MPDGTYLSRNSATLGPINFHASYRWCWDLTHESSLFISVSISIIFHSIPVHNFASRDLQLIPVLQEIEYIPRTRMPLMNEEIEASYVLCCSVSWD
eukprot:UN3993